MPLVNTGPGKSSWWTDMYSVLPGAKEHEAPGHRIIVGVDFGTTFTGVSWTETMKGKGVVEDVRVFSNWSRNAQSTFYSSKVPSRLAYQSENPNKDFKGNKKWGYTVEPGSRSYTWMKLLLDKHEAKTHYDDPLNDIEEHPHKEASEVISGYLSEIYRYLIAELARAMTQASLDATPMDFWFTIPAIWSDQAKGAMVQICETAGFTSRSGDTISLISEPEAAAAAVLTGCVNGRPTDPIKRGDGALVCDCGGGTVDITTYAISGTDPLSFEELVIGTGGKCGSTFIDREFLRWMQSTFGSSFEGIDCTKTGPGSKFMREFEVAKCGFCGDDNDTDFELPLRIPNAEDSEVYDEEDSLAKVSPDLMRRFFQPALDKIFDLVQDQVRKADAQRKGVVRINKLLLVGGFGDSKYLYKVLQKWCASKGIEAMCPEKPQTAIVKGAALRRAQHVKPRRRLCRRHYGFAMRLDFRKGIDPQSDFHLCPFTDRELCKSRVKWAISKGQPVDEGTTFELGAHRWMTAEEAKKPYGQGLYCSLLDEQRDRTYDEGVEKVGEIMVSLDATDLTRFPSKVVSGTRHYKLEHLLQVFPSPERGVLCFKVTAQGIEVWSAEISYVPRRVRRTLSYHEISYLVEH